MPKYEIEQYELHTSKYRVEADSKADAIAKLFDGEAELLDGSLEFIELASDFGMPAEENRDLVEELHPLGAFVREDVICSVRSVKEVE